MTKAETRNKAKRGARFFVRENKRAREPENCRVRDVLVIRSTRLRNSTTIKFQAYYRYGLDITRELLKDKGEGMKVKIEEPCS